MAMLTRCMHIKYRSQKMYTKVNMSLYLLLCHLILFYMYFSSIQEWIEKHCPKWGKEWNISIIRRFIVQQAMQQALEAEEEDWKRNLVIEFVGEEGVDTGGLRREFFSVLFKSSPVFDKGLFSHDSSLLDKKQYLYMGKLVAMAIITGHPGPRCLKDHLVDYILTGKEPQLQSTPAAEISREDIKNAFLEVI